MIISLSALATDLNLNAVGSVIGNPIDVTLTIYLTDTLGNKLTDQAGNYLIAYQASTTSSFALNALASDFNLNAE